MIKVIGGSSRGRLTGTLRSVDTDAKARKIQKNERADELSVPIKGKIIILGDLFASLFFLDFSNKLAV